ncbi:unnamed protein product, partial [Rotaria sp. Silwood1]
ALNASNVEQAFITVVTSIFYKKMPKSVDNSSSSSSAAAMTSMGHVPTLTVPVSSDPQIVISPNQKSFRLKDNQKSTVPNSNGCCKSS